MVNGLVAFLLVVKLGSSGFQLDVEEQAPYRRLPGLELGVFACGPNPEYRLFSSRAELTEALESLAPARVGPPCTELKANFLRSLEDTPIRWEDESLVVLEEYYGTGMATAHLELTIPTPGVIRASIVWRVPPPPVTPDTAVFRFAFLVSRSVVDSLIVTGRASRKTVIRLER
jgi:hypothetical protein